MYILIDGAQEQAFGVDTGPALRALRHAGLLGVGNMTQANSVIAGLKPLVPVNWNQALPFLGGAVTTSPRALAGGFILMVMVGLVILGGFRRIAQVAGFIVPGMCVL